MVRLFIISGPSGAGKTTLISRLFKKPLIRKNFLCAVSFTTRRKRRGEKENEDYFFVNKREFQQLRRQGFFLETQRVLNDFYGTPKFYVDRAAKEGKDLILCIDVKGGKYLKNKFRQSKIIGIFVMTEDEEELYRRLKKRQELTRSIAQRVSLAKKELKYLKYYDYVITNQDLEESVKNLEAVLRAEQLKKCEVV